MRKYFLVVVFSILLLFFCMFVEDNRITENIHITEINVDLDYIEIYNPTKYTIDLDGYSFSDKNEIRGEDVINNDKIQPNSYYVYYLKTTGLSLYESVYLIDNNGYVIDIVKLPEKIIKGSYCKDEEKDTWEASFLTPGKENLFYGDLSKPILSCESGCYDEPFYLSLSSKEGNRIYYTLDGTMPTDKSFLYKTPIYIYDKSPEENIYLRIKNVTPDYLENNYTDQTDKVFIIRAVCIGDDGKYSDEISASYIIGLEKYKNKNIVSLIADPNDLFGDKGIYITGKEYDEWYLNGKNGERPEQYYLRRGKEWEIPAKVDFISKSNISEDDVGISIHGGSNRDGHIKPLSLRSRTCYSGKDYLDEKIFANYYSCSLFLDNHFSDAYLPLIVSDRDVSFLKNKDVVVFLNGELMYDTLMSEKYDSLYFANNYGVEDENVVVMKNEEIYEGDDEDIKYFYELHDFLEKNDLSIDENYAKAKEMIDVQSYIDYFCSNVYLCNMDLYENKNFFMWRTREKDEDIYSDCKWRFCLYDLDCVEWDNILEGYNGPAESINSFDVEGDHVKYPLNEMPIYKALSQNEEFIEDLVISFMDMINYNFDYTHVMNTISPYKKYTQRFDYFDNFFANRTKYIIEYMREEYDLSENLYRVEIINPNGIVLNSLTLKDDFSGHYFGDYPITIKTNDDLLLGYRINGKVINGKEIEVLLTEDTLIEPIWSTND